MKGVDRKHTISTRINDKEYENFQKCLGEDGGSSSEFLRRLIKNKYEKMFPYNKVKLKPIKEKEPELTFEQKCEAIGGEVAKNKYGQRICRRVLHRNDFGEALEDIPLDKSLDEYMKDLETNE